MRISDWSSDVCSSDLLAVVRLGIPDRFQQVENEPRIIEDLVVDGPVIGRALQQESRSGIFPDYMPRTAEQVQVVHRLQHAAERAAQFARAPVALPAGLSATRENLAVGATPALPRLATHPPPPLST